MRGRGMVYESPLSKKPFQRCSMCSARVVLIADIFCMQARCPLGFEPTVSHAWSIQWTTIYGWKKKAIVSAARIARVSYLGVVNPKGRISHKQDNHSSPRHGLRDGEGREARAGKGQG